MTPLRADAVSAAAAPIRRPPRAASRCISGGILERVEHALRVPDPLLDVVTSPSLTPFAAAIASWDSCRVGAVGHRYSIADRDPRASQILVAGLEPQPPMLEPRLLELARELSVPPK